MATAKKTTKKVVTTKVTSDETPEKLSLKIIRDCKQRLIEAKEEVLNTLKVNGKPPEMEETAGDFGDQNIRAMNEHQWLLFQNRLRKQLLEIESALHRIDSGEYGICEETEQPIETQRLLTIPWTRLSLEGAKLRESLHR